METFFEVFSNPSKDERKRMLSSLPKDYDSALFLFGKSLATEVLRGNIPKTSQTVENFNEFCWENGYFSLSYIASAEKIKIVTNWLKNKYIKLHEVTQSDEALIARKILGDKNSNNQEFEVAGNLFKTIIESIDFTNQDLERKIFEEILSFEPTFKSCLDNKLIVKAKIFGRIYVALAEKFASKIVIEGHYSKRIINYIIDSSGSLDFLPLTLNFWKLFSNYVSSDKLKDEFAKSFERLMVNFSYAINNHKLTNLKNVQKQKNFELEILKAIDRISKAFKFDTTFNFFKDILYGCAMDKVLGYDVCLIMIYNIAEYVTDCPDILNFIDNLLSIQSDSEHFEIAVKILGQFHVWISKHPDSISRILNFIGNAFKCQCSIADSAAQALKFICKACKKSMLPFANNFFDVFVNFEDYKFSCNGRLDFVKAFCEIINFFEGDQLKNSFRTICKIQFQKLYNNNMLSNCYHEQLPEFFLRVTSKGASSIFIEFWPELILLMKNCQDEKNLEFLIETIESAVQSYGIELLPILEDIIVNLLCNENSTINSRMSTVFGVLNKIFTLLQETHLQVLFVVFEATSTIIFDMLRSNVQNIRTVVESFLKFVNQFALKFPLELAQHPSIIQTIELAILFCAVDSKNSHALELLASLLTTKKENFENYKLQIMSVYGERIINTIFQASILFYTDDTKLTLVAQIFNAFKSVNLQAFTVQMRKSILTLPNRTLNGGPVCRKNLEEFFRKITCENLSLSYSAEALKTLKKVFKQEN